MITLTLPWPPSELSPNARQHWAKLANAKKKYRRLCANDVMSQGVRKINAKKLHVSLVFHPPARYGYDLDNLLARMKSGLDGLSDVLGVDDNNWAISVDKSDQVRGIVELKIEVLE